MARSPEWEKVPMAIGGDKPIWPLPTVTPKFATWSPRRARHDHEHEEAS